MKKKIIEILGVCIEPELAELKAEEILRLFNPVAEEYIIEYEEMPDGELFEVTILASSVDIAIGKFIYTNPGKEWLTIKKAK